VSASRPAQSLVPSVNTRFQSNLGWLDLCGCNKYNNRRGPPGAPHDRSHRRQFEQCIFSAGLAAARKGLDVMGFMWLPVVTASAAGRFAT
jgi:hypothetical protein